MGTTKHALANVHALVVEDHEDAREILRLVLEYFGAFVVTAASADRALDELRTVTFDVVVADMQLDDRDGAWLLREARHGGITTPFIAVSVMDHDERVLRSQGFSAYLRKPLDHDEFIVTILSVVHGGLAR
jgi:two-component system, chemotaxis family, sensor kinase CheA